MIVQAQTRTSHRPPIQARHVAIASGHYLATEAGMRLAPHPRQGWVMRPNARIELRDVEAASDQKVKIFREMLRVRGSEPEAGKPPRRRVLETADSTNLPVAR